MLCHGPVRVPAEAGKGKAQVVATFTGWKDVVVAPGAFDVPIVDPDAAFVAKARLKNETKRERMKRFLNYAGGWRRDDTLEGTLAEVLEFMSVRYDLPYKLNPADFGVNEKMRCAKLIVRTRDSG